MIRTQHTNQAHRTTYTQQRYPTQIINHMQLTSRTREVPEPCLEPKGGNESLETVYPSWKTKAKINTETKTPSQNKKKGQEILVDSSPDNRKMKEEVSEGTRTGIAPGTHETRNQN